MGTPGDKAEIGKVVQGQLDPTQDVRTTTTATTTTAVTAAAASGVPFLQQPSTSTSTMGVVSTWRPHFHHLSTAEQPPPTLEIHPSLSQIATVATKPESFQASLSTLEQAHIEDYYAQTKYYSSTSESLQILYPSLPQKQQPKAFLSLDEPGPSGLQTPRTRSQPSIAKLKKKKQQTQQEQEQQQSQKKSHTCSVCQKSFVSLEKLSKHQQVHSGASPFKCDHCKKSFTSKFKLVRHMLIHSDQKPFNCTVCERTFHRKDHLKNHIKVHSPSKKIYVCHKPECKKEYTSQMSFRKHQALHAAEEGSLQCQICNSVFRTKDEILYHLKVHAGSRTVKNPSEKKFTCDKCDRKFFTKKDVRRHMVVHTGMRDFLCQFCPQRFGRKDHLVRHIKKSHSKNVPPEDLETAITSDTSESTTTITITKPETIVKSELIKTEEQDIKAEFSESSLSNPEQFPFPLEDLLQQEPFDELRTFLEPEYLPSTSAQQELLFKSQPLPTQAQSFEESILEEIGETSSTPSLMMGEGLTDPSGEIISESVLNDPAFQRLLEPSEEKNLPLPGFSQTFQSPPPP